MRKLKNERGESILMALLLLLLASVISALILTAATSAAHHLRNDRKAQQNYLTVSSAAELIRDSVLNETYTRVYTEQHRFVVDDKGNKTEKITSSTAITPEDKTGGLLRPWVRAGINDEDTNAKYAQIQKFEDTIEVQVTPKDGTKELQTVQASFKVEPPSTILNTSPTITVELSLKQEASNTETNESAADKAEDDCRMTLVLTGKIDTSEVTQTGIQGAKEGEYDLACTTTITWNTAKITKGIKEADSEKAEG